MRLGAIAHAPADGRVSICARVRSIAPFEYTALIWGVAIDWLAVGYAAWLLRVLHRRRMWSRAVSILIWRETRHKVAPIQAATSGGCKMKPSIAGRLERLLSPLLDAQRLQADLDLAARDRALPAVCSRGQHCGQRLMRESSQ